MTTVSRRITFELLGRKRPTPVKAVLSWSMDNPFAVTLHFPATTKGPVSWSMSRDLLTAGLDGPTGLGDVAVLPDLHSRKWLELILSAPSGRVSLRISRRALTGFLASTWAAVPAGAEVLPDEWLRAVA